MCGGAQKVDFPDFGYNTKIKINAEEKIFFEPPVCMHEDCLSE